MSGADASLSLSQAPLHGDTLMWVSMGRDVCVSGAGEGRGREAALDMDSTVVPPNESKLGVRRRILQQQRARQSSAANGQHELASHA